MSQLDFKIVTPEGVTYDDQIDFVTIPTEAGAITVYPEHMPLVSLLKPGELIIHKQGGEVGVAVSGGILEIRQENKVYIIADTAERAEHIDVERAEAARRRAEELLKQQKDVADVDFARLEAQIEKELARIHIGRKYKNVK